MSTVVLLLPTAHMWNFLDLSLMPSEGHISMGCTSETYNLENRVQEKDGCTKIYKPKNLRSLKCCYRWYWLLYYTTLTCHYCACLRNCCAPTRSNHHLFHILHLQNAGLQKQTLIHRLVTEQQMFDSSWKSNLEVSQADQVSWIAGCEKLVASRAPTQPNQQLLSDLVVQSNQDIDNSFTSHKKVKLDIDSRAHAEKRNPHGLNINVPAMAS